MIDTSEFSKYFIIFLVYYFTIIFKLCDGVEKFNTNYSLIKPTHDNYKKYYFDKDNLNIGQKKVLPLTFFKSIHNCDYLILPTFSIQKKYKEYLNEKKDLIKNFQKVSEKYEKFYEKRKDEEEALDKKFNESYSATKYAYHVVKYYEKSLEEQDLIEKEIALVNYLANQMPEVPLEEDDEYIARPRLKNYEAFVDSTDITYYPSNILKAEYDTVMENGELKTCNRILNENEYEEVLFSYNYVNIVKESQSSIEFFQTYLFAILQSTFTSLNIVVTNDDLMKLKDNNDPIKNLTEKNIWQSQSILNNENYMSYLIRMKAFGYVGLHQYYCKSMYHKRMDFEPNMIDEYKYEIYMDIHDPGN